MPSISRSLEPAGVRRDGIRESLPFSLFFLRSLFGRRSQLELAGDVTQSQLDTSTIHDQRRSSDSSYVNAMHL